MPAWSSRSSRPPGARLPASASLANTPLASRTGAPTSGHTQLNPVGSRPGVGGDHGSSERTSATRAGSFAASPRDADDLDAEDVDAEPVELRHVVQRLLHVERRRAARAEVGQVDLGDHLPVAAGDLTGHHGRQLGPAPQPGVREPQPDRGVLQHLAPGVRHGPGDLQGRPGGADRAGSGW